MLLAGYEQPSGDAAAAMDAAADVVALLALTLAPARSVADTESVEVVTAAVNRARSAMYPERMQSQGGLAARASTLANFAAEEGVTSADEIRAWVDALYAAERAIAHDAGTALGIAIIRGDALAVANAADSLRLHADTITDLFAIAVSATERAKEDSMSLPSERG